MTATNSPSGIRAPLKSPLIPALCSGAELAQPKRAMGFLDLVLFYVVTGISLRWIAAGASAGRSAVIIWFGAWLTFYTPLALSVIELSSRYPQEGGLYVWTKRAFGDFGGFICAWIYWTSNLPYFPAVLYFAASNVLYMRGDRWNYLSNDANFYIVFSIVTLTIVTILNVVGLDVGKWLHNAGAVAMWLPVVIIIGMGAIAWHRFGSATSFNATSLIPSTRFKDMIFWSSLPFVAGIDRFLPPVFGKLHPRWRTPYVALILQAVCGAVFVFLGQAGTSVKGAYDALVSMGIVTYFLPYLFLFAAMFRLQREPAGPEGICGPRGKPTALLLSCVGFGVTSFTIAVSLVPGPEEANPVIAIFKVAGGTVALVAMGAFLYWLGGKRARLDNG